MVILTGADIEVGVIEESSYGAGGVVGSDTFSALSYSTRIGSISAVQNKGVLYNLGLRKVSDIVDLQFEGDLEIEGVLVDKKVLQFIDDNPNVVTDSPATGYTTETYLASSGHVGSYGVLLNGYAGGYAQFKGFVCDEFTLACRVNEAVEFRVRGFYKNYEIGEGTGTIEGLTYTDIKTFSDVGITIGGSDVDMVNGFDLSLRLNSEGMRKLGSKYVEDKVSKNIEVAFSMEIPSGGGSNYALEKLNNGWNGDIVIQIGDYSNGTQYNVKVIGAELRNIGESISATDVIAERYNFVGKDLEIEFIHAT